VHHSSTPKDVKSILVLNEEEYVRLMLYGGPQKVMEGMRSFMVNCRLRADMVCCRSVALDAVKTMSST
jgi:hypothetical protein